VTDEYDGGHVVLPAGGYKGPVPDWPKPPCGHDEYEQWVRLWRSPQAAQWARVHVMFHFPLARLALFQARYRPDNTPLDVGREMHELEENFGLTPDGMAALGWVIRDVPDI
jgi:hypothetical protein